MPYDPHHYPQTHDPLGRQFTQPEPGGPVPDHLNLVIGDTKTGETLLSLSRDGQSIELALGDPDDNGPGTVPQDQLQTALAPLLSQLEPYDASVPWYNWYAAYVGPITLAAAVTQAQDLLDAAGITHEELPG